MGKRQLNGKLFEKDVRLCDINLIFRTLVTNVILCNLKNQLFEPFHPFLWSFQDFAEAKLLKVKNSWPLSSEEII